MVHNFFLYLLWSEYRWSDFLWIQTKKTQNENKVTGEKEILNRRKEFFKELLNGKTSELYETKNYMNRIHRGKIVKM